MKTRIMHYKLQRDLLAYYLLHNIGISKAALARILGISTQAVSMQFPTKKTSKLKTRGGEVSGEEERR